jgi:hypothetical protein
VFTVNTTLEDPAGTVTFCGTVAEALPLERETRAPPDGAGAVRFTVPCEELPPTTEFGFSVTDASDAGTGSTVRVALRVTPLYTAEIEAETVVATWLVPTEKVALDNPAATWTLAGTAAAPLLLESETSAPPAGAGPLSTTVPCELAPPTT